MIGQSYSDFRNPLACTRLPYTILLAIGGWSGDSPTNDIEAYDSSVDHWVNVTQEEESPQAYHGAAYVAPMDSQRCYISIAVLNGCFYAMGGFDGYVHLNTTEHYEPATNQWAMIAPMHEQRSDASATTL
ncbi:hypothetical protein P4O66_014828, partial [Electrophorus voltai]